MNRLLITGATGFLGQPSVRHALQLPFEVHATARGSRLPERVSYHAVNLFDAGQVTELLTELRPTHLLHLAWIATPGIYWNSPENAAWVRASQHLFETFARWGGKRAVLTGTCAEYDWQAAGVCRERVTPLRPSTLYGQSKRELQMWSERYGREQGVSVAWARLFFVYGPCEHPSRLVPSVARALLGGEVAACSAGTQERDFLHSSDVASALLTLLESGLEGPVNIGSGCAVPVRRVIELVGQYCGRPDLIRLGLRPTPPNEPDLLVADVTRLREELGWRPRFELEHGLQDAVEWWKKLPAG